MIRATPRVLGVRVERHRRVLLHLGVEPCLRRPHVVEAPRLVAVREVVALPSILVRVVEKVDASVPQTLPLQDFVVVVDLLVHEADPVEHETEDRLAEVDLLGVVRLEVVEQRFDRAEVVAWRACGGWRDGRSGT